MDERTDRGHGRSESIQVGVSGPMKPATHESCWRAGTTSSHCGSLYIGSMECGAVYGRLTYLLLAAYDGSFSGSSPRRHGSEHRKRASSVEKSIQVRYAMLCRLMNNVSHCPTRDVWAAQATNTGGIARVEVLVANSSDDSRYSSWLCQSARRKRGMHTSQTAKRCENLVHGMYSEKSTFRSPERVRFTLPPDARHEYRQTSQFSKSLNSLINSINRSVVLTAKSGSFLECLTFEDPNGPISDRTVSTFRPIHRESDASNVQQNE
ncbi:hypothetical protein B0H13DRAFT_2290253 [Mycena leptocephala]|nr:hypothetical protein B0H13DRAFT_2290253 [Mycena leptocephala]